MCKTTNINVHVLQLWSEESDGEIQDNLTFQSLWVGKHEKFQNLITHVLWWLELSVPLTACSVSVNIFYSYSKKKQI